ncbi:response regulator transcription factor [Desertivirga arenae]|uniref:response regulator transcription factor n=1 Tax=Desertivirga arenae TaxID=2810309 RepID=UPI001A95F5F6|nr:response regulator transcription factor [Pedobacter sp. SYSU D00823]
MFTIGIAEDDPQIAQLIKFGLEEHQYKVVSVPDGDSALAIFLANDFDLVILDVLMPGKSGLEVCSAVRAQKPSLPILLLTALGTLDDKITGFDSGADDYLVKPFHFKELLVRIQALLRRSGLEQLPGQELNILRYEDLSLNTESKEVQRAGKAISLTARELSLLELFLRNPKRLLTRQYIAEQAWDINFDTGTNVIDVYVNFLRNKIEKGFDRKLIHTKINMGYILK